MRKIMVTGHNGFIGCLLTRMLLEKGYEVVGFDTNYFDDDCDYYKFKNELFEIRKDVRAMSEADLSGIDAICHLAALSNDPAGEINPELTLDVNYRATLKIAEMAKKVGVERFLYSSSCSLYGIADNGMVTENSEFNPVTAYAKSKVLSEQGLIPMADDDFCVSVLRNATAYGISPKLRVDLVVNNLIGWAITTGQIKIMSDGTPWRPLIHAEDIARAFIAILETDKEAVNKQAFNVGHEGENYQIKEIAAMVKEVMPECKVIITGEHGSDSRSYQVSFEKIKQQVPKFKPQWTLDKGIQQIHASYIERGMNEERFTGRYFIRLKQLQHLIATGRIDSQTQFWL